MTQLKFKSWGSFGARKQQRTIDRWLKEVRGKSQETFAKGMLGTHSGTRYPRTTRRSSAPGEFPASQSGRLLKSMRSTQGKNRVTTGTNMYYARFLRDGTSKIKPRKMSKEALQDGAAIARPKSKGWIKWKKR